jgi:hypothetical protein
MFLQRACEASSHMCPIWDTLNSVKHMSKGSTESPDKFLMYKSFCAWNKSVYNSVKIKSLFITHDNLQFQRINSHRKEACQISVWAQVSTAPNCFTITPWGFCSSKERTYTLWVESWCEGLPTVVPRCALARSIHYTSIFTSGHVKARNEHRGQWGIRNHDESTWRIGVHSFKLTGYQVLTRWLQLSMKRLDPLECWL